MSKKKKFEDGSWSVYKNIDDLAQSGFWTKEDGILGASGNDAVNSPSHYTQGTQEAIDIIEEAIDAAPSVQVCSGLRSSNIFCAFGTKTILGMQRKHDGIFRA